MRGGSTHSGVVLMRRFLLTVFVGLFLASVAWPQERTCFLCESPIYETKDIVWYAGKTFCSKDCRREHHLDKFRCKICNERYEPKSRSAVRRNGPVTFLRSSPGRTDGYCDFCRDGVRDGSIDPVKDRYKPDRPERGVMCDARGQSRSAGTASDRLERPAFS